MTSSDSNGRRDTSHLRLKGWTELPIEPLDEAWNAMPVTHKNQLVKHKGGLNSISSVISEEVLGIMQARKPASGDFAVIATVLRLILVSEDGSAEILEYSNLRDVSFLEGQKKRYGIDREAYLLVESTARNYSFVIYSDPEWANEVCSRIELAFQMARLQS